MVDPNDSLIFTLSLKLKEFKLQSLLLTFGAQIQLHLVNLKRMLVIDEP